MRFEDIEVGKTYKRENYEYLVKYKDEDSREIVIDSPLLKRIFIMGEEAYKELEPLSAELPEKGLVVHDSGGIIYRTGEKSGYGFNLRKYEHHSRWSFKDHPNHWRPATKQEEQQFKDLLGKEALKRGFTVDKKLSKNADGLPSYNPGNCKEVVSLELVWNKNGLVFELGKWAEPLEDALSEQIEELKAKAKELGLKVEVTIE